MNDRPANVDRRLLDARARLEALPRSFNPDVEEEPDVRPL